MLYVIDDIYLYKKKNAYVSSIYANISTISR